MGYFGPSYKKLAPRLMTYIPYSQRYEELQVLIVDPSKKSEYLELKRKIEDEYIESYYETRLKDLEVRELLVTLRDNFGNNIILLCHEPVEEFCHRRLIADYIEIQTGIYIPEITIDEQGVMRTLIPINYKSR